MTDLGYLAAFAGGVLALLSPCSALLLPSFFAYAFGSPGRLVVRTTAFYVGLLVTLVPLGVGATAVNRVFAEHRELLVTAAGWVLVAFGVVQILGGGIRIATLQRLQERAARSDRLSGTYALGAVYGLAGFCTGPILGAVLTMAAVSGSAIRGGIMLAVYALGMTAPLFLLSLLWDRFSLGRRSWLRGRAFALGPLRLHTTSTISGLLFLTVGALFLRYRGMATFGEFVDVEVIAGAQDWVARTFGGVSDLVVIAAVVVIGLVVLRRRPGRTRPAEAEPSEATGAGKR